jgi:hypothetical protein
MKNRKPIIANFSLAILLFNKYSSIYISYRIYNKTVKPYLD